MTSFQERAEEFKRQNAKPFSEVIQRVALEEGIRDILNKGLNSLGADPAHRFSSNTFNFVKQYYLNIEGMGILAPSNATVVLDKFEQYCNNLLQQTAPVAPGYVAKARRDLTIPVTVAEKMLTDAGLVFDGQSTHTASSSKFTYGQKRSRFTDTPAKQLKALQLDYKRLEAQLQKNVQFVNRAEIYREMLAKADKIQEISLQLAYESQWGDDPNHYAEPLKGDKSGFFTDDANKFKIFRPMIPSFIQKIESTAHVVNTREYGGGFNLVTILADIIPSHWKPRGEYLKTESNIREDALNYIHTNHMNVLFLKPKMLKYWTPEEYEAVKKGGVIPNLAKGIGKAVWEVGANAPTVKI